MAGWWELMKCKVVTNQIELYSILIRYYCDACGFELWDDKIRTDLMCPCGCWVHHEEWEG